MKELLAMHTQIGTHTRGRQAQSLIVALGVLLTAGCGLRFETPDPADPTPGRDEIARSAAIDRSKAFLTASDGQLSPETDPDGSLAAALSDVSDFAQDHLEALGADLPMPTPSGSTLPGSVTPTSPLEGPEGERVSELVSSLMESHDAAVQGGADLDPGLSRLLASIGTSQLASAQRIAGLSGMEAPKLAPLDSFDSGIDAKAWAPIVAAQDQAGYVFEVAAAHLSGDPRSRAQASAQAHRAGAQELAQRLGIDATAGDPRRPLYALPQQISDETTALEACVQAEYAVAVTYAKLVGAQDNAAHDEAVHGLTSAYLDATAWGLTPQALPALI